MRQVVRVQISRHEFRALGKMLNYLPSGKLRQALLELRRRVAKSFDDLEQDDVDQYLQAAEIGSLGLQMYIDDETPIYREKDGAWVPSWLHVGLDELKEPQHEQD
jgi:hypothetical protein